MTDSDKRIVETLKELMAGWNTIEAAAKKQFPSTTKEELFKICDSAMKHALGLTK